MDLGTISYYGYRLMGAVMPRIPPRLGYALFGRLGKLSYERGATARANVHENLGYVLGQDADPGHVEQVARQIFRNQALNYFDLFRVAALSEEQIRRLVSIRGVEHIDEAMKAGKGAILFSAHFGNVDIVVQMFALLKYPVTSVAERLKPERLYRYVASLRGSKGMKLVPIDGFLRPLFRALRKNELVALAADRNLTQTGQVVPFFGGPCLLNDGHVSLALRTGAKLIPAFSLRKPDNTFEAFVEPALELEPTGDHEADLRSGMMQIVAALERQIGKHPEQWVMFQPIWRLPQQLGPD
jgi:lauroyl/myristoyl acyltransferase